MFIKHLELFSGIGGFRQALTLLAKDFSFDFENVGFSEIDSYAVKTYKSNFNTEREVELGDIVKFGANELSIRSLPDFNLLTGGFPCQAFSMMGQQKGFEDARGSVLFEIGRILDIKQPKVLLLENVRNLLSHNKGKTFEIICSFLRDRGFSYLYYDVFDSSLFGLAQRRRRVFVLALREKPKSFVFNCETVLASYKNIKKQISVLDQTTTFDVLEKDVPKKYFLSQKIKPTILADGSKNYHSDSSINLLIARPLTATMGKMHRACQDNYFSEEFIHSTDPVAVSQKHYSKDELCKQNIRRITPKEAFLLQGFPSEFYRNAVNSGLSDAKLYKQAGNAVSVNTVYAILHYLFIDNNISV